MKKFLSVCLCLAGCLVFAGVSHAQNTFLKSTKQISFVDSELACKIAGCLTTSINGGVVKEDCEGPLEVFFLQVQGTDKEKFLAALGYDYDPKTNTAVLINTNKNKKNTRNYNASTGKFESVSTLSSADIPKTPREELLSACPTCTEEEISKIINKYGSTNSMPDLITQSDTACEAILCLGGLAKGQNGGSACNRSINKYKSLVAFSGGDFSPSKTANKRRSWINKCGALGTGETVEDIQGTFGRQEDF